ncbi:MAG TPA: ABC transporter permease [Planctomycetaceae bacterium]|nr:ABC transporter permease [Planctomycetaceae bacterium]
MNAIPCLDEIPAEFGESMIQEWISNWLTPIWILSLGCLFGQLILLALWGVTKLVSIPLGSGEDSKLERLVREVPLAINEGVLKPIWVGMTVASLFALCGWLLVEKPNDLLHSLGRIGRVGITEKSFKIPPTPRDKFGEVSLGAETLIDFEFWGDELKTIVFDAQEQLVVTNQSSDDVSAADSEITVLAGQSYSWRRGNNSFMTFDDGFIEELYVTNPGDDEATLFMTVTTAPRFSQVYAIPLTAFLLIAAVLLYMGQRTLAPRLSGIALSTYKSEVAQPLFFILSALGSALIILFIFLPYNTFGDDIKMMKDTGFSLILIFCLVQLMWAAGNCISDEIDGRTALTVLSKPIGRRSFLVGKFLGISWVVFLLFAILSVTFIFCVAYKPIYDARELSTTIDDFQPCFYEIQMSFPGLVLVLLEVILLTAVSVAVSTRLSLLANFTVCSSIYVLGHLTPTLVQSSLNQFPIVRFFATLIATIVPNLEAFNITAAIAADAHVPPVYLAYAFIYCAIYSIIAMLLAFLLFEDRDLA